MLASGPGGHESPALERFGAEMRRLEKIIPADHDLTGANLRIVTRILRMRARNWRLIKAQAMRAAAGI